jgi:hypothetical protein
MYTRVHLVFRPTTERGKAQPLAEYTEVHLQDYSMKHDFPIMLGSTMGASRRTINGPNITAPVWIAPEPPGNHL